MAIMVPLSSYQVSVTAQGLINPNKSESAANREALNLEKQPIGPGRQVPPLLRMPVCEMFMGCFPLKLLHIHTHTYVRLYR